MIARRMFRSLQVPAANQGLRSAIPAAIALLVFGCGPAETTSQKQAEPPEKNEVMELTHEQTLEWINKNRAWKRARKTKPIWARPITAEEVGKKFQTADKAIETAREGAWLCVGVAEEPWFQTEAKIDAKYDRAESIDRAFSFDSESHEYHVYKPKEGVLNWVAQVKDKENKIKGF